MCKRLAGLGATLTAMPIPFVLSPYLRPVRVGDAFFVDDGMRGRIDLDETMQAVVRNVWNAEEAERGFLLALADHGVEAVMNAVRGLLERQVAFDTQEACDAFLDRMLEAGRHDVPFVDQVELTNICPFRCQFCPRGIAGKMKRPTGKMSLDLFRRLLSELHPGQARWRPLELHHLGESLVHPEVDGFIRAASERGLPTEMSCNPSLLAPDLGKRILDAGIRRLVISLDGMDNETSIAIRGPAARFDKAERHLEALFAHAATLEKPPTIVLQMIDLHRNRHQRQAFLERWRGTGHPFVEAYIKDLGGPDPDTGLRSATPPSYLCSYPWRSVCILWDGRVVPCCMDADAVLVLGDLNHQSLAEIWQGEPVRRLREQLRARDIGCGHLCDGCPWRREKYASEMQERHPDRAKEEPLYW